MPLTDAEIKRLFAGRDSDPLDVSWALSTAATSFARGDHAEALKWLRRAAESASEAENDERALELAKAAAELSAPAPSKPAPTTPKPAAAKAPEPKKSETKIDATTSPAPAMTPKAPITKPRLQQPKTRQVNLAATKKMTREQTKLPPLETKKPSPSEDHTDTKIDAKIVAPSPMPQISAHEADAWPTESMGASDLESLHDVYGAERTRIGALPYSGGEEEDDVAKAPVFRASQAVRVVVWRDGDGELRIAPFGTSVSAVTFEALLVAPGPDVDLLAWLSPA